jgi:tetratricopeptide (TPR) repeat protein
VRRVWLVCLLLAAAVAAAFGRSLGHGFVGYDDPDFLGRSPRVAEGLTRAGAAWAATAVVAANWHPLTLLSHMLDVELFGMRAAGHHATNLALHALNACLIFAGLRAATGAHWPSAFAAALFALHPLNVEPVAWVSQRKTLLSTTLALLALCAWGAWSRRGGGWRYGGVALLLALGLAAKPMLVTLPLALVLVDAWPLGRLGGARDLPRRLAEKLPLLALSAAAGAVAFLAQRAAGAMGPVDPGTALRVGVPNALRSYAWYLAKVVWPSGLAVHYPHPWLPRVGGTPPGAPELLGAAVLLLAASLAVLASRRRYAVAGWLWFLGTLVPVIGLVQVGTQATADRYFYLPGIGLLAAAAWLAAELSRRLPSRALAAALALALLAALGGASFAQTGHWRDSRALYARAVAVSPRDSIMLFNLGNARREGGDLEGATRAWRRALEIDPGRAEARVQWGLALAQAGRADEAERQYRLALESAPELAAAHHNLAVLLAERGDLDRAIEHFERALAAEPGSELARRGLARALRARERLSRPPGPP